MSQHLRHKAGCERIINSGMQDHSLLAGPQSTAWDIAAINDAVARVACPYPEAGSAALEDLEIDTRLLEAGQEAGLPEAELLVQAAWRILSAHNNLHR